MYIIIIVFGYIFFGDYILAAGIDVVNGDVTAGIILETVLEFDGIFRVFLFIFLRMG